MSIGGKLVFIAAMVSSIGLFVWAVKEKFRILRLGKPENRFDRVGERIESVLLYVVGQKKILVELYPGIMHLFIFWGFLVLGIGEIQIFIEGLYPGWVLPWIGQTITFIQLQNVFGLLVLIGVAMAAWRRYILKPARLENNLESALILALIAAIILTIYFVEGLKSESVGTAEILMAKLFGARVLNGHHLVLWYVFWWAHVLLILGFLALIPHSKHLHLIASPFNIYFRSLIPIGGIIRPVNFDNEEEPLGVNRITEFTWKQLLDCYACTQCGRCQDNCAAYLSGKELSPKKFIFKLRAHLLTYVATRAQSTGRTEYFKCDARDSRGPLQDESILVGNIFTENEIWSCTTCGACQYNCPVLNEHVPKIIDLRRHLAMEESDYPKGLDNAIRNLEARGHPYKGSTSSRVDWYRNTWIENTVVGHKPVDFLYWVGCTTALDERNMRIARAFAELMKRAQVEFSIIGERERCCGDPARRMGDDYLYQKIVHQNVKVLHDYGVHTIVTGCPHCYNTFKNEYSRLGASFTVYHHTEYIAKLLQENRLQVQNSINKIVTYHDPCYLGRYNDVFDAPRAILKSVIRKPLAEMDRNRGTSFCCGGGGGGAWMDDGGSTRINQVRAKQALDTGAGIVCTACPFCMSMMRDGVTLKYEGLSENVSVLDIVEIVLRATEYC